MYRGYFHFFVLVGVLALCAINQVSAIKCYVCDSDIDIDCAEYGNNTKFAVDCLHHSFLPTSEKQDNHVTGSEYDCGYARGVSTIDNKTRVKRGCAVKSTTCEIYSRIYEADHNIKLDKCSHCHTDLCNSSGHLSATVLSFLLSFIALYFLKL